MKDEEYLFKTTSAERKRIARGAFNKVGGSRSKKCNFPSDYLTKKQKKELNGKVETYNLENKYSYKEFKDMPHHIQVGYLQHLVDKHEARQKDISEMMEVGFTTFNAYITSNGIRDKVRWGSYKAMKTSWLEFITKPENSEEPVVEVKPVEVLIEEPEEKPVEKQNFNYVATSGTLHYKGDPTVIFAKALNAIDVTKEYYITINYECKEDLTE